MEQSKSLCSWCACGWRKLSSTAWLTSPRLYPTGRRGPGGRHAGHFCWGGATWQWREQLRLLRDRGHSAKMPGGKRQIRSSSSKRAGAAVKGWHGGLKSGKHKLRSHEESLGGWGNRGPEFHPLLLLDTKNCYEQEDGDNVLMVQSTSHTSCCGCLEHNPGR